MTSTAIAAPASAVNAIASTKAATGRPFRLMSRAEMAPIPITSTAATGQSSQRRAARRI